MYPSKPKADKKPSVHTCDACGWEAAGYSKDELKRSGWKWNALTDEEDDKRRFVTCDECQEYFARRREFEAQFAG